MNDKKKMQSDIATDDNSKEEHYNIDDSELKFIVFLHKQEKLLYICFYILLHLSEDIAIEKLMVKNGIVKYIIKTFDRQNRFTTWLDELFLLLLTFAKKLSIFQQNKQQLVCDTQKLHLFKI